MFTYSCSENKNKSILRYLKVCEGAILPKRIVRVKRRIDINKNIVSKPRPYTIKRGLIVVGLLFMLVALIGGYSNDQFTTETKAYADGQNLVSVYTDGQKNTVATSANTVGEALQKMGITLGEGDVVEPALDHQLNQNVTNINIYRAFPYLIIDGNNKTHTLSGYRSPRKVVEHAGIKLFPEDIVSSERVEEFATDQSVGERLTIIRATPVTVIIGGKTFEFRTHKQTVGELLVEKGLEIQPTDVIKTPLETKITPGMSVIISRLGQRLVTQEEDINPTIVYTTDNTKPIGYSEVKDPGSVGKKILTFSIHEEDGKEKSRQLVEEKIVTPSKDKVVIIGPTKPAASNTSSSSLNSNGWVKLRQCESGGNYSNRNNPLYRGAYQFSYSTWNNYGGYRDPADAPPAVQDAKALATYNASGARPWPVCGRFLR